MAEFVSRIKSSAEPRAIVIHQVSHWQIATLELKSMTDRPEIVFAPLGADLETMSVVLAGHDVALGNRAKEL